MWKCVIPGPRLLLGALGCESIQLHPQHYTKEKEAQTFQGALGSSWVMHVKKAHQGLHLSRGVGNLS